MFGKLLKYEFKSTSKWYLLITLIALGLSVITGIIGGSSTTTFSSMEPDTMQMVAGTLGILIFGGVIGLYLSNYYIIIRRFYSNLYGREGYLTWTLPASPHAIILSKFVGALVASLYCLFLLF
ncbi:ABC transporter, ATP-binding protein [Streptococcus sp. ZB199]|nr:ABC transporter, ATP-binding protein [Streptococcus sp. ZB199]